MHIVRTKDAPKVLGHPLYLSPIFHLFLLLLLVLRAVRLLASHAGLAVKLHECADKTE